MPMSKLLFSLTNNLTFTVIGILGIGFIIGFHEFGHFIFCKIFNVRTPRFSIGFGPRLFSKKIGATEFSVSAVPLGGYVEMATESSKGPQDPKLFATKPYYQKLLIIFGGISFNLLFAYLVLCSIFMVGLPKSHLLYPLSSRPIISLIEKDSAADKSGLKVGDRILAINGQKIGDSAELIYKIIEPLANQKTTILIERDGKQRSINITLGKRDIFGTIHGKLGTAFELESKPGLPFFSAIGRGISLTNAHLINTIRAYKHILIKRDMRGLGGPVMIISETVKGAAKGLRIFLLFLAIISINLAVLNLIPLPILDGGQALLFTIEAIIRRQLPERTKEIIFIVCWISMIALIIYLSAKDIWRIIDPWIQNIRSLFGS